MWNTPTPNQLAKIPALYSNDKNNTSLANTPIHLHFFIGSYDWYVAEYDGDDLFFGYANLGDDQMSEWGYISFQELKELKVHGCMEIDCDLHWKVKLAKEIDKIIHK